MYLPAADYPIGTCQSYYPGHQVSRVASFRSQRDPDYPGTSCTIVDYWENGVVVLDVDGDERRFWTHHPIRVWQLVRCNGGRCLLQEERGLLRTRSEDGWYVFSLDDADSWAEQQCVFVGDNGQLYRQLTGSRGPLVAC